MKNSFPSWSTLQRMVTSLGLSICMVMGISSCCSNNNCSLASCSSETPVNKIIMIIGDGMGPNQVSALPSPNNFERSTAVGFARTQSASHRVTDSAASGTAIACGVKTTNLMLGMLPDSTHVTSIMDILEAQGWGSGIVVSCTIDHATPAAYYAHQPFRGMSKEIYEDLYKNAPDVFVGGGLENAVVDSFTTKGYQMAYSTDELASIEKGKVACFLANGPMAEAPARGDTIRKSVEQVLRILDANHEKFFLMVEGSQIDWACHGNKAAYMMAEMEDIDRVIGLCYDYADAHPGTLVVITADHETGGLSMTENEFQPTYSTHHHTGVNVPIFAYGTGASAFVGFQENSDFVEKFLELTGVQAE